MNIPFLSSIALVMLAVAAWSGWLLELNHRRPAFMRRIGITQIRPILQMHIDFILMSVTIIAVDFVVPDRPGWITGLLAYGAVINPLLFLPLAFEGRGLNSVPRQAAMFSSFGALSIGFTALAIYALA